MTITLNSHRALNEIKRVGREKVIDLMLEQNTGRSRDAIVKWLDRLSGGPEYRSDIANAESLAAAVEVPLGELCTFRRPRVVLSCPREWKIELVLKELEKSGLWAVKVHEDATDEQTMFWIEHAFLFVALVDSQAGMSSAQGFQLGFAKGLNVPAVAFAVGPDASHVAGIEVRKLLALTDLPLELTYDFVEQFSQCPERHFPARCVPLYEDRTSLLSQYASALHRFKQSGMLRQEGGISVFSLPDIDPNPGSQNEACTLWSTVEGEGSVERSDSARFYQASERRILERHALQSGCKLIIRPLAGTRCRGHKATIARLTILIEFLKAHRKRKNIRLALPEMGNEQTCIGTGHVLRNITIVGDWLFAESREPRPKLGYLRSLFSHNSQIVRKLIDEFDSIFQNLDQQGCVVDAEKAIAIIQRFVEVVKNDWTRCHGSEPKPGYRVDKMKWTPRAGPENALDKVGMVKRPARPIPQVSRGRSSW